MQNQNLKNEIQELKNVILHLAISLFKDKKLCEEEILDLLADAVIKRERYLKNERENEWRL